MSLESEPVIVRDRGGRDRLVIEQGNGKVADDRFRAVREALSVGEPELALARNTRVEDPFYRAIGAISALSLLQDPRASLEAAAAGLELRVPPKQTSLLVIAWLDRLNYLRRYEKAVEIGRRAVDALPYHPVLLSNYLVALGNQPEAVARKLIRAELRRLGATDPHGALRDRTLAAIVSADPDHALTAELVTAATPSLFIY